MTRAGASLIAMLLAACSTQDGLPGPLWDIGGFPQAGYTYEGRIWVGIWDARPGYGPVVDESNLHLIAWPEGTEIPVTLVRGTSGTNPETIDLEPASDLDPDRWYAVRWDATEPITNPRIVSFRLHSGVFLDEDSVAWPFWSTSGPILFSVSWVMEAGSLLLNYSTAVAAGPAFEGTVTQGTTTCALDYFRPFTTTLEGACPSFNPDEPFMLHVRGVISTGTGVELAPIDRELMLGPDGPFVQLNDPLEWPPFEGAP